MDNLSKHERTIRNLFAEVTGAGKHWYKFLEEVGLTPREKEIVNLSAIEQKPKQEIANELNIQTASVPASLGRSLKKLKPAWDVQKENVTAQKKTPEEAKPAKSNRHTVTITRKKLDQNPQKITITL